MGRSKAYKPAALRKGVEEYFDSITRQVTVTEMVPTGRTDKYGHPIMEEQKVKNALGDTMKRTEFIVPPSLFELCRYLGIHKSTWRGYGQKKEYRKITEYAMDRMEAWKESLLYTREGKDLRGVEFDLTNNHYANRKKSGEGDEARQVAIAALAELIAAPERERSIERLTE